MEAEREGEWYEKKVGGPLPAPTSSLHKKEIAAP